MALLLFVLLLGSIVAMLADPWTFRPSANGTSNNDEHSLFPNLYKTIVMNTCNNDDHSAGSDGAELAHFDSMKRHSDFAVLRNTGFDREHFAFWNKINVKVHIITQNRLDSLKRLCKSLSEARYLGSKIDLTFNIEANVDSATSQYITQEFKWPHGKIHVHQRIQMGKLMAAVTESWYPVSDDEYAIILEDDIEVSPLYFLWAKMALIKYRYMASDPGVASRLFGISLYTPRVQELNVPRVKIDPFKLKGEFHIDDNPLISENEGPPFLWQLPCSWGAVFFPDKWREFNSYLRARLLNTTHLMPDLVPRNIMNRYPDFPSGKFEVIIPESRSNVWKESWKKYMIELIVLRGYLMLYPNYWNQTSFSTNHLEPGIHIRPNSKVRKRIDEFRVPLMRTFATTESIISDTAEANDLFQVNDGKWMHMSTYSNMSKLPVWNPFAQSKTLDELDAYVDSVVIHDLAKRQPQVDQESQAGKK